MALDHVSKLSDRALNCFAELADFNYILFIKDPSQIDKAYKIAERELHLWCCPEEAPPEDYDYYYNAGYAEVVEEALENQGIEVLCYDDIDDEIEPETYLDKELDIFSKYIAENLDALGRDFDLYEYNDQVDDPEEHIAMLKKSIESGKTQEIKTFLKTLQDDNIISFNDNHIDVQDNLRADYIIKKLDTYESMKAAKEAVEQRKMEQETKDMAQFLGKRLLPPRGRR